MRKIWKLEWVIVLFNLLPVILIASVKHDFGMSNAAKSNFPLVLSALARTDALHHYTVAATSLSSLLAANSYI